MPISSLPSEYGIGCFDERAYEFIDLLRAAGQTYWQILPLGPTGYGDSPYQSFSTFAGNPYFIDLHELIENGLLTADECKAVGFSDDGYIDYRQQYEKRFALLKKAFLRIGDISSQLDAFSSKNQWLDEYALFMAVKDHFGGSPWERWDENIRNRDTGTLERYREQLSEVIGFYKYLQYLFYEQWGRLRKYANENGVRIIGDIPIYVAYDSSDVWSGRKLFRLERNGLPTAVAGCPPDGFSAEGQLWGNPLYDWEYHRLTGYSWWISRLRHCFDMYDVVRIDHFRGFDEYYAIPFGDKDARNGKWEKGPGIDMFRAVECSLGRRDIVAEDLGFMTDSVKQLVKECGFPNMKVLQFAFDSRDDSGSDHLPHNYHENCVAYTGTHDNQTIRSWFSTISDEERSAARAYLCDRYTPEKELYRSFIGLIMRSRADLCIIPMQDWLGLDDSSRINTPSTVGNNWRWRAKHKELSNDLAADIRRMTELYGRI